MPALLVVLALSGIGAIPIERAASEPSCAAGWYLIADVDNSFRFDSVLPAVTVAWSGTVQLLEYLDDACAVLDIVVGLTGPGPGGELTMSGNQVGLFFSVEFPQPYTSYDPHRETAYGDAVSWNPDGIFTTYYAHTHPDINSRGAEEFFAGTLYPLGPDPGLVPTPAVVSDVYAFFRLPLELRGQTVYAQAHVYPNLCTCVAVPLAIP